MRGVRGLENKLARWHKVPGERPALRWRSRKGKMNPRDTEQKELTEHGEMKTWEYIFKLFVVAVIEMFLHVNSPKVLWKRKQGMGLNLYTHAPLSPVVPGYLGPLLSFDLTICLSIITFYFPHLFLEKLSESESTRCPHFLTTHTLSNPLQSVIYPQSVLMVSSGLPLSEILCLFPNLCH